MSCRLRPRKQRPSYVALAGIDIEDHGNAAGPSDGRPIDEESNSESEFEPDKGPGGPQNAPSSGGDGGTDVNLDTESDAGEVLNLEHKTGPRQRARKPRTQVVTSAEQDSSAMFASLKTRKEQSRRLPPKTKKAAQAPSATPRVAKMYALPNPSAHHRHRAIPVFLRKERVERLIEPPSLFKESHVASTNSMTVDPSLTARVSKAWGFNIGAGPVWQIMEDRSCYKESVSSSTTSEKESSRRPRVYRNISVRSGWEVLPHRDALQYLPADAVVTGDSHSGSSTRVACHMGPHDEQTRVTLNMFDSVATSEYFEDGTGYAFNAGSPVWGIDWCPTYQVDRPAREFKHYLAVAPFPSRSHAPSIGVNVARPSPACVQLWTLRSKTRGANGIDESHDLTEPAEICCEMVLCMESGPALELKWCPLPAHDKWEGARSRKPRKLGLLAGTFEDGSLSVYVIPDPQDVRPPRHETTLPVFVKLPEPVLRIEHDGASCWSLDWANSEVIAVGLTNGCLAVYNVKHALDNDEALEIFPTHFIAVHQSAIRALAWIRVPPTDGSGAHSPSEDPTIIASGGYDGVECLTDIREPHGNVVNRTRDVINSVAYSAYATGPIMIDHDNAVKSYSVSPSMLGRGHILMEPDGPIWSVSASDYHPQLAVGSADGSCTTTNTLRSTRRGGTVPFLAHKIYQLDYSRKTGEFRMLEHFLPQETQDRSTNVKSKTEETEDADANGRTTSTGIWPPEIGVHRVVWNNGNGLGGAPLLASATGSGLCRVDWLMGRWLKDKTPYVSIPKMRKEVEGSSDESDEDA